MRRLMAFSGIIVIALTMLIGSVVSVAHTAPLPGRLLNLHLTDCESPCWIGIVPGQTTIADARQRVKEVFANSPIYTVSIDPLTASSIVSVMLFNRANPMGDSVRIAINAESGGVVDSIKLDFPDEVVFTPVVALPDLRPDSIIRVSDLHQIMGAPSQMLLPNLRTNQANFAALVFGNKNRGAVAYVLSIDQEAPVLSLIFFSRVDLTRPLYLDKLQPWQGFVSTKRYVEMLLNANSLNAP